MSEEKTRVMIVDDQAMPRALFEQYIAHSDRYQLAVSVPSAYALDVYLLQYKVDLIVLDLLMNDGSDGLDAAAIVKEKYPEIKIVAVTSLVDASYLARAREIGVESFWYKEAGEAELLDVMDRTMAGESVYPSFVPQIKIGHANNFSFSDRELEVLREMTTGASNAECAARLHISENTIKVHVRNMLRKTQLSSRTELAIKARTLGIVAVSEKMDAPTRKKKE